jgi:ESS family glutamate:Na+ symporter
LLELDPVATLAFAGLVLFAGYGVRRLVRPLARHNIPAPVIGGLIVALAVLAGRSQGVTLIEFRPVMREPLMIAFFTTIGFGASFALLKKGGPQVVLFFIAATLFAVLQNVVGGLVAIPFGLDPLFGVLAGSVTLTGGPATGLAFAPLFEQAGVPGAASIAVAAAMFGIVAGGIVGAPIGTALIERKKLKESASRPVGTAPATVGTAGEAILEALVPEAAPAAPAGEDVEAYGLLKALVAILVAMWLGAWVSRGLGALGMTLPAYIGAMLVAAVFRNIDDATGLFRLSERTIDDLGNVALSLFLAMALMTLNLAELAGLALPLIAILAAQVALIAVGCWGLFRLMGRDYEAAVMSAGFTGFMLGTTANAMANMKSLSEKYGPAPRAFLVVPMVGAFFIDFTNALIITGCLNILR